MPLIHLPLSDPGRPDLRSAGRFLAWLGRSQRRGRLKAVLWSALGLGAQAAQPYVIGRGVQAVIDGRGTDLWFAGAGALLLSAVTSAATVLQLRQGAWNWVHAASQIRQLIARRATVLGPGLSRRIAVGEVVAVSSGDVEKIGWYVEALARLWGAVLVWLGISAWVLFLHPLLGLTVLLGVPVLAISVWPLIAPLERRIDRQRELGGEASELAADTVAGLRVLRGIGGEELFLSRYRTASQKVRVAAVRVARVQFLMRAQQVLLPGLFVVAVTWYGATLAVRGRIGIGDLIGVYGATAFLAGPLLVLGETAHAWSVARVSSARAVRVLGLGLDPDEPSQTAGHGELTTEEAARSDLHDPVTGMTATAGHLTAVVCGDPDLAGAIAERLGGHLPRSAAPDAEHAPARPRTLLGGVPLDALPLQRARALVLVHDKDPALLSGTLAELFAVPASGRVTPAEALRAVQARDALDALADGSPDAGGDPMRARITERGRSLSGGQRQRLALARSLVADPPVLVLDEPTSAVDAHTENRIATALRRIRAGRTTVVFATSPLLLDRADRVLFVQDGRVAAAGTHRHLIGTDHGYRAVVTRDETGQGFPADAARETV
ncbi:ABC transporter ATP-binding protein [Streptomyces acidiscabies]|uniref:ABC transporter ATP-binding protein n=1 Tax=Streptomyces acidiscabies TaxID=42234 RepID=UPI0030CE036E